MSQANNGIFEEQTSTLRESLSTYLRKWPLFLVCIILSVSGGIFYTRYAIPKYMASTAFLIKSSDAGKPSSDDLIESALNGKREINLNNEIILISASSLMERTVVKNGFNVSYFRKGRIKNIDIYNDIPFTLTAKNIIDSNSMYSITVKKIYVMGGTISFGPEKKEKSFSFHWNVPFDINGQTFILTPKKIIEHEEGEFIARWQPVSVTAGEFSRDLSVKSFDAKTSVILLSIKTENIQKGKEILNALFNEFSLSDKEDQRKVSESTVHFIDERLIAISEELKGVEGHLENYQGINQLSDIKSQSTQSLENSNDVSKIIKDLSIKQGVTTMILDYFTNPSNGNKLVPSALGLNDATLASLITQYNELQLKKERETPLVAPNSTVMQDLNTQISSLKGSIFESLSNISKNLKLQENTFTRQNNQYKSFLSSLPHNERVMQEIKRKQSITEGLYLYLLQKREEAAISSTASNVVHYRQIDPAIGYGPVEPNNRNIILFTAILGLFVAFSWIYIKNLLNDKINSKEDVSKRLSIPILGQISHISKKKKEVISAIGRTLTGEEFRAVRTNISFLLKSTNKKAIMVTSSISSEGKSFISLNLAAVCAMPGKKVALLEFDLRQPTIFSKLNLAVTDGLSNYLAGEIKNISEIRYVLDEIPSLHIYPCGAIPLNPADILLSENLKRLFASIREEYDYVIIDSPPAGLVSDAFVLGEYSDMVLYIIRNQRTTKKQLEFIKQVIANKTLSNVNLVLNDVKLKDNLDYNYGYYYQSGDSNGLNKIKKKFSST